MFDRYRFKEIKKPTFTFATEPETLKPQQLYTLLDARTRDWRQILLAMTAATVAMIVAAINAMDGVKPCWIPIVFFVIAAIIFAIGVFFVLPEVQETRRRADVIRTYYIRNWDKVPPVDGFIPSRLSKTPWKINFSAGEGWVNEKEPQKWSAVENVDIRPDKVKAG